MEDKTLSIKSAKDLVISSKSIKETVQNAEALISNGVAGGVEVIHFATYLEKLGKGLRASQIIREDFIHEVEQGVKDYRGAKIEKAETGVKYDFSNSEAWRNQKQRVDTEVKRLKEIEAQCKTATKIYKPLDPNTGELMDNIAPAIKTSTTSPKVTIK